MSKTKKAVPSGGGDILESPEALAEQLSRTEEFLEKNKRVVFTIGGIIGIALLAFFGYRYYIGNQDEIAQRELFQAVYYFEADSLGKALNGDGLNYGFLDVISEYGGTKAANLANYYAGATYMQLGDFESALRYLERFGGANHILQAHAFALIGDAHSELKDHQSAAENYERAANFKPNKNQVKVPQLKWIDDVETNRKKINPKEALKVNDFANDLLRKKNISKVETHSKIDTESVTKSLRARSFTLSQITGVKDIEKNAGAATQ